MSSKSNVIMLDGDPYAGGGGGSHTIIDSSGTELEQEDKLKFGEGFNAVDDNANGQTIVTPNKSIIASQNEIASLILTGDKPSSAISQGAFFVDKNGALRVAKSAIATTDDVDNTNSEIKPIGDVLRELNSNLTDVISASPSASVSVPNEVMTELAQITLINAGTYIINGYHDFDTNVSGLYQDVLSAGTERRASRNHSLAGGGGASFTLVVTVSANTVIKYDTYRSSTGNMNAQNISLNAVKVKGA